MRRTCKDETLRSRDRKKGKRKRGRQGKSRGEFGGRGEGIIESQGKDAQSSAVVTMQQDQMFLC